MAGGKKRKQGKKKREEQQQQSPEQRPPPEQVPAPVSSDSIEQQLEELEIEGGGGGMMPGGLEGKVSCHQSPSRNDDSDIDDDDVPSELLPVHWRNPALDVEIEIEDPPEIAAPISGEQALALPSKESSQPEQLKELILEQPEQYFEDPFSSPPEPPEDSLVSSSLVDSGGGGGRGGESSSPKRQSLTYVSAWGHMAPQPNSDDESELKPLPVASSTGSDDLRAVSDIASHVEIPERTLEELVKDSLKGPFPSSLSFFSCPVLIG